MNTIIMPLTRSFLMMAVLFACFVFAANIWPLPSVDGGDLTGNVADLEEAAPVASARDVILVRERPLFHENRKKPVAVEKTVAAPVVPRRIELPYTLAGVVGSEGENRTAYLYNKRSQETLSVTEGQKIGVWLVKKITATTVVLEADGDQRTLEMTGGG